MLQSMENLPEPALPVLAFAFSELKCHHSEQSGDSPALVQYFCSSFAPSVMLSARGTFSTPSRTCCLQDMQRQRPGWKARAWPSASDTLVSKRHFDRVFPHP